MPLSHEEFKALRAQGLTVGQIVAAERGASPAPAAVAAPVPQAPMQEDVGSNPFAGALGGGADVMGGLRGVGIAGGGLGGAYLLRRALMNRGAPPAAPSAAPVASVAPQQAAPTPTIKIPATLHEVTAQDIASHPELARFSPGYLMRRSKYEAILLGEQPAGRTIQTSKPNLKVVQGGNPAPTAAEAGGTARPEPVRPITVEGRPANAPANVRPNGPGVGRGASGPALARRAMARAKAVAAPVEAPAAMAAPESDLEAQMMKNLEMLQMQRAAGESAVPLTARTAMLRNVVGGMPGLALQLLPYLLGTSNINEDAAAANRQLSPEALGMQPGNAGHPYDPNSLLDRLLYGDLRPKGI